MVIHLSIIKNPQVNFTWGFFYLLAYLKSRYDAIVSGKSTANY